MNMTAIRTVQVTAAVLVVAAITSTACSSNSNSASVSAEPEIVVNAHNAADEQYLTDLLADRDTQEALATLALDRSTNPGVRRAAKHMLTPDPQFVVMRGWATEWAHDYDGDHAEDAANGSVDQLARLPQVEFNRAWMRDSFGLAERIAHASQQIQMDGQNAQVKASAAHQRDRAEALMAQLGELSAG